MPAKASLSPLHFFSPVVWRRPKFASDAVLEAANSLFAWGNKRIVVDAIQLSESKLSAERKILSYEVEDFSPSPRATVLKVAAYGATLIAAIAVAFPMQALVFSAALVIPCCAISMAVVAAFCIKCLFQLSLSDCSWLLAKGPSSETLNAIWGVNKIQLGKDPEGIDSYRFGPDPSWIFMTGINREEKPLSQLHTRMLTASDRCRKFPLLEVPVAAVRYWLGQKIIVQEDPSKGKDLSALDWNSGDAKSLEGALRQYVQFMVGSGVMPRKIVPLASSEGKPATRLALTGLVPSPPEHDFCRRICDLIDCLHSEAQIDVVLDEAQNLSLAGRITSRDIVGIKWEKDLRLKALGIEPAGDDESSGDESTASMRADEE